MNIKTDSRKVKNGDTFVAIKGLTVNGHDYINEAIKNEIKQKDANLKGTIASQGTTPRRYTDLIGSLCDLTSGSGDKGTPVVYISGYFDNYSMDN